MDKQLVLTKVIWFALLPVHHVII